MAPTQKQISELAYALYVEEGRPEGRADWHWNRAVEILSQPPILPSDPHSGPEACYQHIDLAVDHRSGQATSGEFIRTLLALKGVKKADPSEHGQTIRITYDARHTNPAAIFDAIEARKSENQ
jgi:hypothetical protein